jgi:hypothetical protein
MNAELIDRVAWVGRRELRGPVRGIVLRFQGLGSSGKGGEDRFDLECGDAGALIVSPHHDPWAWMNAATVDFVDELIAALTAQMGLSDDVAIISTGGSIGGHGALAFTLFTRRPVVACSALFPMGRMKRFTTPSLYLSKREPISVSNIVSTRKAR